MSSRYSINADNVGGQSYTPRSAATSMNTHTANNGNGNNNNNNNNNNKRCKSKSKKKQQYLNTLNNPTHRKRDSILKLEPNPLLQQMFYHLKQLILLKCKLLIIKIHEITGIINPIVVIRIATTTADSVLSNFQFICECSKYDIDISIREADDMTVFFMQH